mgnify:CR=1 FL=1
MFYFYIFYLKFYSIQIKFNLILKAKEDMLDMALYLNDMRFVFEASIFLTLSEYFSSVLALDGDSTISSFDMGTILRMEQMGVMIRAKPCIDKESRATYSNKL